LTPEVIPKQFYHDYAKVAPDPKQWPGLIAKISKMALDWKGFAPEDVQAIKAPVLVMVGDRDIIRTEHAVQMFRLLPKAQLAVLPGASHFVVLDRPD
jgi:pimeloyl-ACP methyl ester carboxylesterase